MPRVYFREMLKNHQSHYDDQLMLVRPLEKWSKKIRHIFIIPTTCESCLFEKQHLSSCSSQFGLQWYFFFALILLSLVPLLYYYYYSWVGPGIKNDQTGPKPIKYGAGVSSRILAII